MKVTRLIPVLFVTLLSLCFSVHAQTQNMSFSDDFDLEIVSQGFSTTEQAQVRLKLFNRTSVPIDVHGRISRFVVSAHRRQDESVVLTKTVIFPNQVVKAHGQLNSEWIDFPIPANVKDVYLSAKPVPQFGTFRTTEQSNLARRSEVVHKPVSYVGKLDRISAQKITDATPVIIQGRAIDPKTQFTVPYVGLNVIFTIGQFEKKRKVVTDAEGKFTYAFKHHAGESGDYEVAVVNPTVSDRPVHGQFSIKRVAFSPEKLYRTQQARLLFGKASIKTGTEKGKAITEKVILRNTASTDAKNVNVTIESPQNLTWARLLSAPKRAVFEKKSDWPLSIGINPPKNLAQGSYPFLIKVTADNASETFIAMTVSITSDKKGDFGFRIEDIYTNFKGKNGNDGVPNASVTLTNDKVKSFSVSQKTDKNGRMTFKDLPVGIYRYRASAPDHNPKSGEIWVRPGVKGEQKVFLNKELVRVEWKVTEVTIEDEYDIVIDMTYETDVPAPVIVMEPPIVKLPPLKEGEVFKGELKITNYGLVKTTDVKTVLPKSDDQIQYDFLEDSVPDVLSPMQTVYLPYRATAKKRLGFDPKYVPLLTKRSSLATNRQNATYRRCLTDVPFFYDVPLKLTGTFECANGDENESDGESRFDFAGKPYPFLLPCGGGDRAVCMTSVLGLVAVPTFCGGGGGGGGGGSGGFSGGRKQFPGMSDCRPEVANECDEQGGGTP